MRVACLAITKIALTRKRENAIQAIYHIQLAEIAKLIRMMFHNKKSIITQLITTAHAAVSILVKTLAEKATTTLA